jgi:N-acetylmuramoyl-L-alanine amidase
MAARWVGLKRPHAQSIARAKRGLGHTIHDSLHALGAAGVLIIAAAMNFAVYPDALAAVVTGERPIVSFVPSEQITAAAQPELQPMPVNEDEVRLLAATAWGEARSEGESGMRAVAHVMVNRVGNRFGEDLATVILSPKQFSVWNRGDPNRRLVAGLYQHLDRYSIGGADWDTAQRVAREVLSGQSVDPTNGALFYHTRAIRPRWSRIGQGRQVIGAHVFYADVPDPGVRDTPRTIDVAQFFRGVTTAPERTQRASSRGRRAGRVNGVIQYAPPGFTGNAPAPTTTIDVNAAPVSTAPAPTATPVAAGATS